MNGPESGYVPWAEAFAAMFTAFAAGFAWGRGVSLRTEIAVVAVALGVAAVLWWWW